MAEMDMSAAPGGEDGGNGGPMPYTICIYVDGNGKMSVGVEQPEAPGEDAEPMGKPVPSARDAISMVMDIIKSGGNMPDSSGDDEFNKGFGKSQDGPMLDKMKYDGDDQ
jgi:hypothetical protein